MNKTHCDMCGCLFEPKPLNFVMTGVAVMSASGNLIEHWSTGIIEAIASDEVLKAFDIGAMCACDKCINHEPQF